MGRALAFVFAVFLAVACGSDDASAPASPNDAACPPATAATCPDSSPTYDADIAPLFAASCVSCHAPGGVEAAIPLTTYAEVSGQATSLAEQIQACLMPEAPAPPLSLADRKLVLQWFRCGIPQR